jgi:outer membrane immunogenic protein
MQRLAVTSLAAASLTLGLTALGSAADLGAPAPAPVYTPVYSKAPPPPVRSWTGCYLGAEGGYAWGTGSVIDNDPGSFFGLPVTNGNHPSGGLAGGTIGCNYQTGMFVVGVENDMSWTNLSGTSNDQPPFNTNGVHGVSTSWLDTARARVGVTVMNSLLFYATGGAAFTDIKDTAASVATTPSISYTATGWTAGGGVEWMLPDPHWSVKAEYLYADFGTHTDNFSAFPTGTSNTAFADVNTHLKENVVRAGINYRFW